MVSLADVSPPAPNSRIAAVCPEPLVPDGKLHAAAASGGVCDWAEVALWRRGARTCGDLAPVATSRLYVMCQPKNAAAHLAGLRRFGLACRLGALRDGYLGQHHDIAPLQDF